MRLFIAAQLSESCCDEIIRIQNELCKSGMTGNLTKRPNLHITLNFIGETPSESLNGVCHVIEKAAVMPSFFIELTGFSCLGRARDLLAANINGKSLYTLNSVFTPALNDIGIKTDGRKYSPHITVCRRCKNMPAVMPQFCKARYPVTHITLFESKRVNGELMYIPLKSVELTKNTPTCIS